jgi:diguanylate cyclase (GGDEF)-like protein/PAS domain S-box-containing protein
VEETKLSEKDRPAFPGPCQGRIPPSPRDNLTEPMPALPGTLRNDDATDRPALDLSASAAAWFAPGSGPLALYAGPAALFDPAGKAVAANAMGEALLPTLLAAGGEFTEALHAAVMPGATAGYVAGLELARPAALTPARPTGAAAAGSRLCLDLDFLPCAGGVLLLGRDVSLERALRGALVESRQRLRDLVEIASDFTWETDADGRFTMLSPQGVLGFTAVELIGRDPRDLLMLAEDIDCFLGRRTSAEIWMRDATGKPVCQHILALPLVDETGATRGARGLARDITDDKARAQDLAAARHRERLLVHFFRVLRRADNPREALDVALRSALQAVGATGAQLYRWPSDRPRLIIEQGETPLTAEPLAQAGLLDLAAEPQPKQATIDGYQVLAMPCQRQGQANGNLLLWRGLDRRPWDADDLFLLDELSDQLALVIHQLTGHEELWRLSGTDSLTGLLNRRGFMRALAPLLGSGEADAAGPESPGGVLVYIDLDNFKELNDRRGHATGDAALIATAEMLRHWCRDSDLLARLGGDEFVVWITGLAAQLAQDRAVALLQLVEKSSFFAPDADPRIGMSIGIASLAAGQPVSVEQLLQCADRVMYDSKRQGKGRISATAFATAKP